MFENLKIALKKQRKLLAIFLVAVFLPSLLLGIFGIRSIRNQRYEQARRIELDHRRAAESLRTQVSSLFGDLELTLRSLAQNADSKEEGRIAAADSVRASLGANPLVESVFFCFKNEEPWFPLFQPKPIKTASKPSPSTPGPFQETLERAGTLEFVDKDHEKAAAVYGDLAGRAGDRNFRARMLHERSRCQMKMKDYARATAGYERIGRDFPETVSPSGIPLALTGGLMKIQCYGEMGEYPKALGASFELYQAVAEMRWSLNEMQFRTYGGLVEERIEEALAKLRDQELVKSGSSQRDKLRALFQEKLERWKLVGDIKQEVIPELWPRVSALPDASSPVRYAKAEKGRSFLAVAVPLADKAGFLGLTVNADYLLGHLLPGWMSSLGLNDRAGLVLSDLEGKVLLGSLDHPPELRTVTEFFAGNFPPWKMEFYKTKAAELEMSSFKNSFYFWTVLTLVVILTFGTVLIIRTIAQELDILRLKSDFVSSVSHEFKTPLTSMKALLERLEDDKVQDRDRMKQYFSLLSQSADRLIRLVKNLLDFSKIEEGRKEYNLAPTDIAELVAQEVRDFEREEFHTGAKIRAEIADGFPLLKADREALAQALHNLLDNAVKFSPERKEIKVSVRKEEGSLIIEVADQGIGMPPDELERIFEKFYQGQNAVRQIVKGTGLGLTLVKHTVEAHGGKILVRSRVGEGSTFSLVFPIKKK